MVFPQILVIQTDGLLAQQLRPLCQDQHWSLRELRQLDACISLVRKNPATLLVLQLGQDLLQECAILEQIGRVFPAIPVVVVAEIRSPALEGLVWDLGASYVFFPPQSLEDLPEVVSGLLHSALASWTFGTVTRPAAPSKKPRTEG